MSPVLAAGEQAKAGAPALRGAKQSEALQVVVPKGKSLDDSILTESRGGQAQLYRAVEVAKVVVRAAVKIANKHPFATGIGTGTVVGHYVSKYVLDPFDRAVSKAWKGATRAAHNAVKRAGDYSRKMLRRAAGSAASNVMRSPIVWPAARAR